MLPFRSRRSSTLLMSNLAYFASRTPSATFSKSQKSAMFTVSLDALISGPWTWRRRYYPIPPSRLCPKGLKSRLSRTSISVSGASNAYGSSRSRHGVVEKRRQPDRHRTGAQTLVRLRRRGRSRRCAQRPSGRARHRVRQASALARHLLDRIRRAQFPAFARGGVRIAVALLRGGGGGRGELLPGGRPGRAQLGVRRPDARVDPRYAKAAHDRRPLGASIAPFRRRRDRRGDRTRQSALRSQRRRGAAGPDSGPSWRCLRQEAPALETARRGWVRPCAGRLPSLFFGTLDFLMCYIQFTM